MLSQLGLSPRPCARIGARYYVDQEHLPKTWHFTRPGSRGSMSVRGFYRGGGGHFKGVTLHDGRCNFRKRVPLQEAAAACQRQHHFKRSTYDVVMEHAQFNAI